MTIQPPAHIRLENKRRREWAGFSFLLLILLPVVFWRGSMENSISVDESYSLVLGGRSVADIIDFTSVDDHPPLYYLLLKYWLAIPGLIGIEGGIGWARGMSALAWVGLAAMAWFGGRRVFGARPGTLAAWMIAASPQALRSACNARGYALAMTALFGCGLLMAVAVTAETRGMQSKDGPRERFRSYALWGTYGVLAACALWIHLLSTLVLGLLGLVWLGGVFRRGRRRVSLLVGGGAAQAGALLTFAPWLWALPAQLARHHESPDTLPWQSPATLVNWARVFGFWYPLGEIEIPPGAWGTLLHILGALSALVPFGVLIWMGLRRRIPGASPGNGPGLMAAGALIAVANVSILWITQYVGISSTFHGPRYPVLTSAFWSVALAGACVWAAQRNRGKYGLAWVLAAPWFVCCMVGQLEAVRQERAMSLGQWIETVPRFPAAGATLYIMSPELLPFYRNTLGDYRLRPVSELLSAGPSGSNVAVLNLNPWQGIDHPRDVYARCLIHSGLLADSLFARKHPEGPLGYVFYLLEGFQSEAASRLEANGFAPAPPLISPAAASIARHESQRMRDGWSSLNAWKSLHTTRAATAPRARMRFDKPVGPGKVALHVTGFRIPDNSAMPLAWAFEGEPTRSIAESESGAFHLVIHFTLTRRHAFPRVRIEPTDASQRGHEMFQLLCAWIEPVE